MFKALLAFTVLSFTPAHADDVTEITFDKATAKGTKAYTCKQAPCEITGYVIDLSQKKVVFDPKIYVQADQRVTIVADGKSTFQGHLLNATAKSGAGEFTDILGKKRSTKSYTFVDVQNRLCVAAIYGAVDRACDLQPVIELAPGVYPMDALDANSFTTSYGVLNAVLMGMNTGSKAATFFPKGVNTATLNLENDQSSLVFRVEHGDKAESGTYIVTIRIAKSVKAPTPAPEEKPDSKKQPELPKPGPVSPDKPDDPTKPDAKKPKKDGKDPYDDFDPSDFDF